MPINQTEQGCDSRQLPCPSATIGRPRNSAFRCLLSKRLENVRKVLSPLPDTHESLGSSSAHLDFETPEKIRWTDICTLVYNAVMQTAAHLRLAHWQSDKVNPAAVLARTFRAPRMRQSVDNVRAKTTMFYGLRTETLSPRFGCGRRNSKKSQSGSSS